jgi:hypothetical protein
MSRLIFFEENDKDFMVSEYSKGITLLQIGKKFGVNPHTIRRVLLEKNIKIKTRSDARREFFFDQDYFKIIDTPEKAQILGFIYADGNVCGGQLNIVLASRDKDYLYQISRALNYEGKITDKTLLPGDGLGKNICFSSRLSVRSIKMIGDLNKKGVFPAKSLTLKFPTPDQVPNYLLSHFIRGYFDGDGSICIVKKDATMTFCGTMEFLKSIQLIIKNELNVNSYIRNQSVYKNTSSNINSFILTVGGNKQVKKLYYWLYENFSFSLKRKLDKFLELEKLYHDNIIKSKLKSY